MWYVLNFIPPRGRGRSWLGSSVGAFNAQLETESLPPVSLFAPTFVSLRTEDGRVSRSERPLLYHYVFVRGDDAAVKRLCRDTDGFSFVLDHAGTGRHLQVSDEALEQFRIIADFYSGKLPCYSLEDVNLEEGDLVQVVSGPFAGLQGTYMSRRGGKSGNILISVDGAMAAVVYDVKADYVRVLEFARDSRRVYDQLDAFADRLKPLLVAAEGQSHSVAVMSGDGPLSRLSHDKKVRLLAAAGTFSSRLCEVKIPNPKLAARLYLLLYAAYSILADTVKAASAYSRFVSLRQHITNRATLSFVASILALFPPKE